MIEPAAKREAVAQLRARCIVNADRKMVRYRSCRPPDLAFGYRRLFVLLRRDGAPSGINRIYRLYREEGLTVRKRRARRREIGIWAPILVEAKANACW